MLPGNHLKDGMCVSYGGSEHNVAPFEVLTFEDRLPQSASKMILQKPSNRTGSGPK
jgi:hypothetical protein